MPRSTSVVMPTSTWLTACPASTALGTAARLNRSLRDARHVSQPLQPRQNQPAIDGYWSRYTNPRYDALLDDMAPRSAADPLFQANAAKALEIYWKDQIDIPIVQWLHRIPYNQTYWTNWPTEENPAGGTNVAFWAHTGMLVITQLKARQ